MGIVNAVPIFFGPRHKMSVSPKVIPFVLSVIPWT
jgi:hypothetical protein